MIRSFKCGHGGAAGAVVRQTSVVTTPRGAVDTGAPPPPTKKLFVMAACWQREVNILQWSVTVCINHTPGQPRAQEK